MNCHILIITYVILIINWTPLELPLLEQLFSVTMQLYKWFYNIVTLKERYIYIDAFMLEDVLVMVPDSCLGHYYSGGHIRGC